MWGDDDSSERLRKIHIAGGTFCFLHRNGGFPALPHVNTAVQSFFETLGNQDLKEPNLKVANLEPTFLLILRSLTMILHCTRELQIQ